MSPCDVVVDPLISNYPPKGVALHYHFAKLQLNSLALRGLAPTASISVDCMDAANAAVASAMAALNLFLHEPDICTGVIGLPLFKHTMLTFAAVFLLKVSCQWSHRLHIDHQQVLDLIQGLVDLVRGLSINRRHLMFHIVNGLAETVQRIRTKAVQDARETQPPADSIFLGPIAATNAVSRSGDLPLSHQQPPPSHTPLDPHLANLFDDFAVVDGLNLAPNDWLFYSSLDVDSNYPEDTATIMPVWGANHNDPAVVSDDDQNLPWQ
jgi:hypothetical protein